jgi:L-lactate dehydrogenase (cytochrome)
VLGNDSGMNDYIGWLADNFDPGIRWRDLDWLRDAWDGPLVIKGILDPDDARDAATYGAQGLVVSNHGGRQLDGALSVARALPAIADAVGDRMTILADGGVRSGLDVVRLLALGARGVLLGRAWLWALAAEGEAGVDRMLTMLEKEMRVVMTLAGCNRVTALDRTILADFPSNLTRRNA